MNNENQNDPASAAAAKELRENISAVMPRDRFSPHDVKWPINYDETVDALVTALTPLLDANAKRIAELEAAATERERAHDKIIGELQRRCNDLKSMLANAVDTRDIDLAVCRSERDAARNEAAGWAVQASEYDRLPVGHYAKLDAECRALDEVLSGPNKETKT